MIDEGSIENSEVSWLVDDIALNGTLTYPKGKTNGCGVVFIAGSGPTDRDWCSPLLPGNNGSAKLLAELLACAGFAVLRYDKRPSGPHIKENILKLIGKISMKSHVDEVAGAVQTLVSSGKADAGCIFALTSSEGEIHALNYQLKTEFNRFRGLVLTGAPGRSIGAVVRTQIQAQFTSLPDGDAIMNAYDSAISDFAAGKHISPNSSLPELIRNVLLSLDNPANLPFTRELWLYDPSQYISKVDAPVLIVIGKKDVQVDWQLDGAPLEAAVKGKVDVSFVYPENANHVLKFEAAPRSELTGMAALKYNADETKLDPQAADAIVNWLKRHLP